MKHLYALIIMALLATTAVALAQINIQSLPQAQALGANDNIIVDQLISPSIHRTGVTTLASLATFLTTSASASTPTGFTTVMSSAAPAAGVFSVILVASTSRHGCFIQNVSSSSGYVYFGGAGSATTGNSFQVAGNGGTISCNVNGMVLQDNVSATCASGSCSFIIATQ